MFTLGNDGPIANKETGYSYDAMVENMPQIFHTASIWLTLLLALQRYIYVCHAPIAKSFCTVNKAKLVGIFYLYFLCLYFCLKLLFMFA